VLLTLTDGAGLSS